MGYLEIELLAHTVDEHRYREAERFRRINKAPATRQKQPANPVQILVRWLQSLATHDQRVAPEQTTRALAELS
jgi:hypothetical protein